MLSSTTRVVFILSLLLRLSVLKVNGESVFIDGRYIDYEFGHQHTCSYDMPANITMAQSGMKFDIASSLVEGFLDLGDARPFGILAATAIVNSGNTSCLGDMGLYGGSSIDDGITVSGNLEVNSNTANLALLAAGALRIAADQLPCDMTWNTSLDANLAQRTFLPGVHCWTSPDIWLTGGDMYLDGDGDPDAYWVLRIDGDFTVGSSARPQAVHLVNGGSACNVFWVIGGGVMLHSGSQVYGTIIANNSITLSQSSSVLGGIISLNGEVNLYDAIIDNGLCSWNTRDDHNITFTIYAAEMIPLPLTENSTILTWTDLTAGFEIVSEGGSLSSILMTSPELTELQLTWVQSAIGGVQVWYIPPYTTSPMVIDCEVGDDNRLRALSNRGQGTYFFVVVDVTEWTVPDASNSSSSTGGGGDGSSGSDGGSSSSSGSEGSSGSEPPISSSSSDDNSTDSSSSGTEGSSSGSEGSSPGSEGSSGSSGDSSSSGSGGGGGSDSSSGSEGSSSGSDGSSSGSEGSSSGSEASSSGSEGSSSGSDGGDSSSSGSDGSSSGTPGSSSSSGGGGEGSSGSEGGSSSSGSDGGSSGSQGSSSGSETSSGSGGGSDDSSSSGSEGSSSGSDGASDSSSSGSDDSSSGGNDSSSSGMDDSSSSGSDYNSTSSLSGDDDSNSTSSSTGIRFSSTGRRNGTHNGAYATKGSTATTTAHILVTVSAIFATLRVLQ